MSNVDPIKGRNIANEATKADPDLFDAFKDTQGRFRTQSLFIEKEHPSYPAHFTLKKWDALKNGKKYISMYLKYMEIADPTEYLVAKKLLGSWDHWLALKSSQWFSEELAGWRAELQVKLESTRYNEMRKVLETSSSDSPQAIQATKWLAERYGSKKESKRGRPSKDEVKGHLKRLKAEDDDLQEDLARIGIAKNG